MVHGCGPSCWKKATVSARQPWSEALHSKASKPESPSEERLNVYQVWKQRALRHGCFSNCLPVLKPEVRKFNDWLCEIGKENFENLGTLVLVFSINCERDPLGGVLNYLYRANRWSKKMQDPYRAPGHLK